MTHSELKKEIDRLCHENSAIWREATWSAEKREKEIEKLRLQLEKLDGQS